MKKKTNNWDDLPYFTNDQLPTLEFYENAFKQFREGIKDTLDYEQIKKAYLDSFDTYPILFLMPVENNAISVFRARTIDETKEDLTKIQTFSYNPNKEFVTRGRANLAGSSVFYGSFSEIAAIKESKDQIKESQILYLSKWRIKNEAKYNVINFLYDDSKMLLGEIPKMFNSSRENALKNLVAVYDESKQSASMYYIKELGHSFLDSDHKVSSFMSHYYFFDNTLDKRLKAGIIIYPSIQCEKDSMNLAITPDFVDHNMELKEVMKIEVKHFESGGAHVTILDVARVNGNKEVEWKKCALLENNILRKGITFNFCENVFTDSLDDNPSVSSNGKINSFQDFVDQLWFDNYYHLYEYCWSGYHPDLLNQIVKMKMEVDFNNDPVSLVYPDKDLPIKSAVLEFEIMFIPVDNSDNEEPSN